MLGTPDNETMLGPEAAPWPPIHRILHPLGRMPLLPVLIAAELAVAGAVLWAVLRISDVSGESILDASFGYDHAAVMAVFDHYGPDGFGYYRIVQLLDLVHPLLYSLLAAALLHRVLAPTRWAWLALTPFLAGALDYVENGFLWVMTETYPNVSPCIVAASSVTSVVKGLSFLPVVAAALVALRVRRDGGP